MSIVSVKRVCRPLVEGFHLRGGTCSLRAIPHDRKEAREHDLMLMDLRSKLHGADLPSTSPSCAGCKKRSEQRYYREQAHPPVNVAVPQGCHTTQFLPVPAPKTRSVVRLTSLFPACVACSAALNSPAFCTFTFIALVIVIPKPLRQIKHMVVIINAAHG